MVVLKQGFLNIFMFMPHSLISIIIVHGPLPTRMQDHCDNSSNYAIKIDYSKGIWFYLPTAHFKTRNQ